MSFMTGLSNQIIKLTTRNFKAVAIVVVVILLSVGYLLFIGPKLETINQYKTVSYDSLQSELEDQKIYLEDLKEQYVEYNKWTKADIDLIEQVLPDSPDNPGIFSQMEKMISDAGYTLTTISISRSVEVRGKESAKSADAGSIKTLTLQLGIKGPGDYGYDNMKTLLRTVEKNLRILDLVSFSYNPQTDSLILNVRTYYLPS